MLCMEEYCGVHKIQLASSSFNTVLRKDVIERIFSWMAHKKYELIKNIHFEDTKLW
jgi:hypothetical protein